MPRDRALTGVPSGFKGSKELCRKRLSCSSPTRQFQPPAGPSIINYVKRSLAGSRVESLEGWAERNCRRNAVGIVASSQRETGIGYAMVWKRGDAFVNNVMLVAHGVEEPSVYPFRQAGFPRCRRCTTPKIPWRWQPGSRVHGSLASYSIRALPTRTLAQSTLSTHLLSTKQLPIRHSILR